MGFPGGDSIKHLPADAGDGGDLGSIPGSGKMPWGRAWQPSPVFLRGESNGQREEPGGLPSKVSQRARHD